MRTQSGGQSSVTTRMARSVAVVSEAPFAEHGRRCPLIDDGSMTDS
jgi:hypothetical protein